MKLLHLVLLGVASAQEVRRADASTPWPADPKAHAAAEAKKARPAVHPPVYTVDLDAPAATRWNHIAVRYKDKVPEILAYFEAVLPKWALPLIEGVAAKLTSYFHEYGEEMVGVAEALNISRGAIVMLNLVMQLEALGVNCSNWNETGPTRKDDPGCMAVDPKQTWCYCHKAEASGAVRSDGIAEFGVRTQRERDNGPGMCTSVVAQGSDGRIVHGRNLDWNLPTAIRSMIVDVDFIKGGKKIFRGTGAPGIAGVFNGMSYTGAAGGRGEGEGWSVTIDARGKGGRLLVNILQSLLVHSMTPTQHMRYVLEQTADFKQAVLLLSTTPQVDENYFIVGGTKNAEGAVISRGREKADDVWRLNPSEPNGWYRLQTNYDHWNPVPTADDRRTPGNAAMRAMGPSGLSTDSMWSVISTFPVYNVHTDVSVILVPKEGLYNNTVWMG